MVKAFTPGTRVYFRGGGGGSATIIAYDGNGFYGVKLIPDEEGRSPEGIYFTYKGSSIAHEDDLRLGEVS